MTKIKKKIKALSFFSGAMGLDIGLEKSGIDIILACESEKFIRETIKLNKPNLALIEDINKYSSKEIKQAAGLKTKDKVDLIVGGPPCQAFSTAGKRLSINENRGIVFYKFLEVIRDLNPTYFVIENVRGLLSVPLKHIPHKNRLAHLKAKEEKGGTFLSIVKYLEGCGYKLTFELYNSANFGTPQVRERIVIMGHKKDKLPYLTPTHSKDNVVKLKPWKTFKSATKSLDNIKHTHVEISKTRLKYFKKLKSGQNWKNLTIKMQKEAMGNSYFSGGGKTGFYRRLDWDKPSPTLVTDPTMPATDLVHPKENRPLSIEEYKKIQEFPINWKLSGNIRQQYKQLGNAVPVSLGKAIGTLIMNHFNGKKIKNYSGFRYSRYLNTNDIQWSNKKKIKESNQEEFKF